ncbi:proline-specific permease [Rhexocercosporidium sp. MPI-PUGE-AT-0058]|nr:proline-specific permease [Rhexocercosporidium sp. MPI-PUGE-AT-0058]
MDHEKPEVVCSRVYEYFSGAIRSPVSPDTEHPRSPPINGLGNVDERKKPKGERVWRVLSERHINMIAFSGTIGNGLFLGCGTSLAVAGAGGSVLSYLLMGTFISSIVSSLCEMTALMPVNAPVMEFPRRFLDRGVGFAVGWMYWFAYAVLAADELVAVSNTINFRYDDKRTVLNWTTGNNVDNAVWISLFLVIVIGINMFPFLVLAQVYLSNNAKARADAYYTQTIGSRYWDSPYSFFNPTYHIKDEDGHLQRDITGTIGTFLAMWTTIVHAIFAYVGMDIIASTAAESKSLADAESMKMGARKINLRIITLYALAMLTVSFVVPRDHEFLNGKAQSVGAKSPFIIAVVEAGIPSAAHFFNAIFVFSSFTCAINSMYVASRVLHTLALQDQTGPEFIARRLRACRSGVPIRAVLVTAAMMLIGFMGRTGTPGERLSELASNCPVTFLIVYTAVCATYLSFFKTLDDVKLNGNTSESQAAMYDRDHIRYPYKSHGQWLKAAYGMTACLILLIFNGIAAFLEDPFETRRFIASYIGIPVFIFLIIGYKIRRHGFRFNKWGPERSNDLRNTIQASSETRKGKLEFPDTGFTKKNGRTLVDWIWVWLK